MNNRLSLGIRESYVRIPLKTSPHIRNADALEMDWADVIAPADCSYVLGNPPSEAPSTKVTNSGRKCAAIAQLGGSGGTLDT